MTTKDSGLYFWLHPFGDLPEFKSLDAFAMHHTMQYQKLFTDKKLVIMF